MPLRQVKEENEGEYHAKLYQELLDRGCTKEEMEAFYKVMSHYTDALQARPDLRWNNIVREEDH